LKTTEYAIRNVSIDNECEESDSSEGARTREAIENRDNKKSKANTRRMLGRCAS
jgi:hypothetical protein